MWQNQLEYKDEHFPLLQKKVMNTYLRADFGSLDIKKHYEFLGTMKIKQYKLTPFPYSTQ